MRLSIGRLMKGVVVGFGFPVAAAAAAGEGEENVHSTTQALRARQLLMTMEAMETHRGDCIGGHGQESKGRCKVSGVHSRPRGHFHARLRVEDFQSWMVLCAAQSQVGSSIVDRW